MNEPIQTKKQVKLLTLCISLTVVVFDYGWSFLYYGWLYQTQRLISITHIQPGTIPVALIQHLIVNLPAVCLACVSALILRKQFMKAFDFKIGEKRCILFLMCGVYVLLLTAALLTGHGEIFGILYQWIYYLVFIALAEEFIFRGVLPVLIKDSQLPKWCIWVIPGVAFGLMHTLLPAIRGDLTFHVVFSSIGGYLLTHCIYVRYGGGRDSFVFLTDFMSQHELPMRLCGGFFCLLGICLFIAVVRGKTHLPKWCALFNIMIFYPILMIFGYPGYMSMGAIVMFSGIFVIGENKN